MVYFHLSTQSNKNTSEVCLSWKKNLKIKRTGTGGGQKGKAAGMGPY